MFYFSTNTICFFAETFNLKKNASNVLVGFPVAHWYRICLQFR